MPRAEYVAWAASYSSACSSLEELRKKKDKRPNAIEDLQAQVEAGLTLQGATANEDKLQPEVPETIALLARAGIKLWMVTGDKQETAVNIGFAAKLLDDTQRQIVVSSESAQGVQGAMRRLRIAAKRMRCEKREDAIAKRKLGAEGGVTGVSNLGAWASTQMSLIEDLLLFRSQGQGRGRGGSRAGSSSRHSAAADDFEIDIDAVAAANAGSAARPAAGSKSSSAGGGAGRGSINSSGSGSARGQVDLGPLQPSGLGSSTALAALSPTSPSVSLLGVGSSAADGFVSDDEEETIAAGPGEQAEAAMGHARPALSAPSSPQAGAGGGSGLAAQARRQEAGGAAELPNPLRALSVVPLLSASRRPFALVIDESCLDSALADPRAKAYLLYVAVNCAAVIACRARPDQKAQVVKLIRNGIPSSRTLAGERERLREIGGEREALARASRQKLRALPCSASDFSPTPHPPSPPFASLSFLSPPLFSWGWRQ
jgi:magnesium-transporting ATPase (P-type)